MSSSFSYSNFVKIIIDNSDKPILPAGLCRQAMIYGAPHGGEDLRKRLREACDAIGNQRGYKRIREKGVSGYQYQASDMRSSLPTA